MLDGHLRGREFIGGAAATIADFATAYTLDWANEARLLDGFSQLVDYMERMYARPQAAPRIWQPFAALSRSIAGQAANPGGQ